MDKGGFSRLEVLPTSDRSPFSIIHSPFSILHSIRHMPPESLHEFHDADADYHAIIAIHSTHRGPAIGGTRMRAYESVEAARFDALGLAEAMSRKTALAGLRAGGGKSVILAPAHVRSREALLRAHGRAVESLKGLYITAPDVGLTPADLDVIARETRWVARHETTGGADGSDTARGTLAALRAAVRIALDRDLAGLRVAIQGCGSVGAQLATMLAEEGVHLCVCDLDDDRARAVASRTGARVIDSTSFIMSDVDVLAPCALGGVFDADAARVVRASVIAGAANNQLVDLSVADDFMAREILMVPDVVASAGGVIAGFSEFEGAARAAVLERIDAIGHTVAKLIGEARAAGLTPTAMALARADRLLGRP